MSPENETAPNPMPRAVSASFGMNRKIVTHLPPPLFRPADPSGHRHWWRTASPVGQAPCSCRNKLSPPPVQTHRAWASCAPWVTACNKASHNEAQCLRSLTPSRWRTTYNFDASHTCLKQHTPYHPTGWVPPHFHLGVPWIGVHHVLHERSVIPVITLLPHIYINKRSL